MPNCLETFFSFHEIVQFRNYIISLIIFSNRQLFVRLHRLLYENAILSKTTVIFIWKLIAPIFGKFSMNYCIHVTWVRRHWAIYSLMNSRQIERNIFDHWLSLHTLFFFIPLWCPINAVNYCYCIDIGWWCAREKMASFNYTQLFETRAFRNSIKRKSVAREKNVLPYVLSLDCICSGALEWILWRTFQTFCPA